MVLESFILIILLKNFAEWKKVLIFVVPKFYNRISLSIYNSLIIGRVFRHICYAVVRLWRVLKARPSFLYTYQIQPMPKSVERGKQRKIVPAFRVAISGHSKLVTIRYRYEIRSTNSVAATSYALRQYHASHPQCEVSAIRVTSLNA